MFSFLVSIFSAVLLQAHISDTDAVQSIVDNVLSSYKIEYINRKTGETFTSVDDLPAQTALGVNNPFFDWHYTTGIINSAILDYYRLSPDQAYIDYVKKQIAYPLSVYDRIEPTPGGNIDWNPSCGLRRYNELDFVGTQNGAIMDLNALTGENHYAELIERAAQHIRHTQQRFADGTLVRLRPRRHTLWADDLYMGLSFMTRYAKYYSDKDMLNDAIKQVDNYNKYLWVDSTHLYMHGYYEEGSVAGCHWGRSNAWIMKATCELLDVMKPGSRDFKRVKAYLKRQIDGVLPYQCESGMWRQVLNDPLSYEETSCTIMFAGAIAHAVSAGWVDMSYADAAIRAWEHVKDNYIVGGKVQNVCVGTSLRDDINYYLSRPVSGNDAHATGSAISTGLEIIALKRYLAEQSFSKGAKTDASLFWKADSLQVKEISAMDNRQYNKVGHHGPAVENGMMGLRIYFNNSGAIDVYSKVQPGLELSKYRWYPSEEQIVSENAGCDEYYVGKSLGLGGIALWDDGKTIPLEMTEGRKARVGKTPHGHFAEVISYGILYKGVKVDISVRVDVYDNSDYATVTARCLNNHKVQFVTGVNYNSGAHINTETPGCIAVWGTHPANVSKHPSPIGAAMKYDISLFPYQHCENTMVSIVSRPCKTVKTQVISVSARETGMTMERFFSSLFQ